MGEALTGSQARSLLRQAFIPCSGPRWGLEVEWVVHRRDDPTARCGRRHLADLVARTLPAGSRVTLEPGGQLELSTTPRDTVDGALDALAADASALEALLAQRGLVAVDVPVDLHRWPLRILDQPRYRAMEAFFDHGGSAGRWMMCNTASVQVNVSHDPGDAAARWRLMQLLAPVLLGAFANSPGRDSSGEPWASLRQGIWQSLDPGRTAPPRSDLPAEDAWCRYALAADVMLVRANGEAHPCSPGVPFATWLGRDLAGRRPTADDLAYHATTLFPPVRPRGWLELRVLDALPASAREVAVLVIAACLQPPAARALTEQLPLIDVRLRTAATRGLEDPLLADAARLVFETAIEHIDVVTDQPQRRRAVATYAQDFVFAGLQPWGGRVSDHQPQTLVDLRPRNARPVLA